MNCFHAQTRHYLSPSPTVCCWLGVIYAAFEQVFIHDNYLSIGSVIFVNLHDN